MTVAGPQAGERGRLRVGLACDREVRRRYIDERDLALLGPAADFSSRAFAVPAPADGRPSADAAAQQALAEFARPLDVLLVCHGARLSSARTGCAARPG